MDLATGAMGSLLPKLVELLNDEYKLQKGVKKGIRSLENEMKSIHGALRKVAQVPRDQLDEQVKLWAEEVRELSFNMEDLIDKFLVRVDDESETATESNKLIKRLTKKMVAVFTKGKARHEIADAIKDINEQVQEVADRRERYNVDNIVAMSAPATTIDPRLKALYTEVTELVGISGKRDEDLMKLLSDGNNVSNKELKIVSVVGFGGLGKTTLVKTVYDKIKEDFDCKAFVPVGRNADAKKVFMDILVDLGIYGSRLTVLDERQLIDKLRESLRNKRYLIVIDDIWDEELWKIINLAFPRSNNAGSRIITTTRIVSVSKLCCSSINDSVYQMEPLNDYDSKSLFYKRIVSPESGCPHEFEEVSKNILKKCGGVPLAIITVASLLASDRRGKNLDDWHALLKSIGRGLTEDPGVEEMFKILSFSYYDLPSHLKTCLLYLSLFPEDYKIKKDRLIWIWIAESFVQSGKSETSFFEIGETYFNELVNRNMILPVYDVEGITVVACQVHDMVLDLISSFSREDNFVIVMNGTGNSMSSESNVRRLSLQNARKGQTHLESVSMFQVRSIAAFGTGIDLMPSFLSFVVLRVLDLTGYDLGDRSHLNLRDLGSLLHLRYLGLADTNISNVPEEVGKLQFLQVLDLSENRRVELPSTAIKLRRLMCLLICTDHKRLPDGLGTLASMEVLSQIHCDSLSMVKELGGMERMRELGIEFDNLSLELEEALVESLGKMSNIQKLVLKVTGIDDVLESNGFLGERWMPPRSLQEFRCRIELSTLPAWMRDPSHLSQLCTLVVIVWEARQDALDVLKELPALRSLTLFITRRSGALLIGAHGFHYLTSFHLTSLPPCQLVFQAGAMPKVEIVELCIKLGVTKEEALGNVGDFPDLGIGNLLSLRSVVAAFTRSGLTIREGKRTEDAVVHALNSHPNRPIFDTSLYPYMPEDADDNDICPGSSDEE